MLNYFPTANEARHMATLHFLARSVAEWPQSLDDAVVKELTARGKRTLAMLEEYRGVVFVGQGWIVDQDDWLNAKVEHGLLTRI